VVFQFGLLGTFKGIKLVERKVVTVVFRTRVNSDIFGDDVVGDPGHGFLTNGAGDG